MSDAIFLSGPPRRGWPPPRHGADRTTRRTGVEVPRRITRACPALALTCIAGSGSDFGAPVRAGWASSRSASFRTWDERTQIDPEMISIPDQRIMARLVRLMLKFSMGAFQRRNSPLVPDPGPNWVKAWKSIRGPSYPRLDPALPVEAASARLGLVLIG
jgi:hypothetical protein